MKRKDIQAEDLCLVAYPQYERMIEHVDAGIIDIDEIVMAMTVINSAHYACIRENKRHLIK